jgi:hypothetical protein
MSRMRLLVGNFTYDIDPNEVEGVTGQVENALKGQSFERLQLLDHNGKVVNLFLNGATVDAVAIETNVDPKPTEIGGGKPSM